MSSWLAKLRGTELHRLATLLGGPSSGTKAVKIQSIEEILLQTRNNLTRHGSVQDQRDRAIRLLSIDMGVKNLAYAFLTTTNRTDINQNSPTSAPYKLEHWRKFDISVSTTASDVPHRSAGEAGEATKTDHAYHPAVYATRAYSFVQSILNYDPTHIIIERQRFRSAGSPSVQEWSIRVGVFEAMLWTVLHTLMQQNDAHNQSHSLFPQVEGILPARVNQFWLGRVEGQGLFGDTIAQSKMGKPSGKEMKKAKIKLAMSLLDRAANAGHGEQSLHIGDSEILRNQVNAFKCGGTGKLRSNGRATQSRASLSSTQLTKLDDLADCLLQGIAWLGWRKNRIKIIEQGQNAFNLNEGN